jgi:formylglycine-generating enzyme required for sulfatase activity/tRNA A-37 threonylcarbamoyl transferase component Bud32
MAETITIPGYTIETQLGQGGMATVYLAHDQNLDRQVALKVMPPTAAIEKSAYVRFIKEARTAANLHNSHIVSIYDAGESAGTYFMAMEYLPGGSLRDKLKMGALAPGVAMGIARQMTLALACAHEAGFVHRDIKPENILFRQDGVAVLTDFGIAKAVWAETRLTQTGASIGTPHYMSPEQIKGQPIDGRSDLYALGIVLYEMLLGWPPYRADTSVVVAIKHLQEPIPQLPGAFASFQPMLDKLLAKEPGQRYQTAVALQAAIDSLAAASIPAFATGNASARGTRPPRTMPDETAATRPNSRPTVRIARQARRRLPLTRGLELALVAVLAMLAGILIVRQARVHEQPQSGRVEPARPTPTDNRNRIPYQPGRQVPQTHTFPPVDLTPAPAGRPWAIEMVPIPAGTFVMGSAAPSAMANQKPAHTVSIHSFFLGKYEVTQRQWLTIMARNPSPWYLETEIPVYYLSWNDVQVFIRLLNQYTGKHYRLPTEAEWEYACRAGGPGESAGDLEAIAWHGDNAGARPHPVGQKLPNRWGLFDMIGNVGEFCSDWYAADYYSLSPRQDPQGPAQGSERLIRGNDYLSQFTRDSAPVHRRYAPPDRRSPNGFRLAADAL